MSDSLLLTFDVLSCVAQHFSTAILFAAFAYGFTVMMREE